MSEECGDTSDDSHSLSENLFENLRKSLFSIQNVKENESFLTVTKQEIQFMSPKNDRDSAPSAYEENPIPPEPTLQTEPMGTTPSLDHQKAAKETMDEEKKDSFKRCLTADAYRTLVSTTEESPAKEAQIRELLMGYLIQDTQENGYDYIASILIKLPHCTMLDFFNFFYTSDKMDIELAKAYIRGVSATYDYFMPMEETEIVQEYVESVTSYNELKETMNIFRTCFKSIQASLATMWKDLANLKADPSVFE